MAGCKTLLGGRTLAALIPDVGTQLGGDTVLNPAEAGRFERRQSYLLEDQILIGTRTLQKMMRIFDLEH